MSPNYLYEAESLIRQVEGCVLHPYLDTRGKWTVGIGCTRIDGQPVTGTTPPITVAKADEMLGFELAQFDADLTRDVKVPLTVGQRAALLSFTYNLGEGNLKASTLLRKLNAKDYGKRTYNADKTTTVSGAAGEFPGWNKQHVNGVLQECFGLTRRRKLEQSVFLGEISTAGLSKDILQSVA